MSDLVRLAGLVLVVTAVGCGSVPDAAPGFEVDPAFFALGALYEYVGYPADLPGDGIDTFDSGRNAEAIVFAQFLERLAEERNMDAGIVVRPGGGGCTTVASRPMRDHLVSLFPDPPAEEAAASDLPPPSGSGMRLLYSSARMFAGRESKLSYLAGAHLRFGRGGVLIFANSAHKVSLVRDLLVEVDCTEVEATQSPRGHYPVIYTVSYVPSSEIAALFAWVDGEVAEVK